MSESATLKTSVLAAVGEMRGWIRFLVPVILRVHDDPSRCGEASRRCRSL